MWIKFKNGNNDIVMVNTDNVEKIQFFEHRIQLCCYSIEVNIIKSLNDNFDDIYKKLLSLAKN